MALLPIHLKNEFETIQNLSVDKQLFFNRLVVRSNLEEKRRMLHSFAIGLLFSIASHFIAFQFSIQEIPAMMIGAIIGVGSRFLFYRWTQPITFEANLNN